MKNKSSNQCVPYHRLKPLMEYFKIHGSIADIKQNETFEYNGENVKIGWLVTNLRQDKKKGLLSQSVIELLDYMEMNWNLLKRFKRKYMIL